MREFTLRLVTMDSTKPRAISVGRCSQSIPLINEPPLPVWVMTLFFLDGSFPPQWAARRFSGGLDWNKAALEFRGAAEMRSFIMQCWRHFD